MEDWSLLKRVIHVVYESGRRRTISFPLVPDCLRKHAVGTGPLPNAKWRLLLRLAVSAKRCSLVVWSRVALLDLAMRAVQFGVRSHGLEVLHVGRVLTQVHVSPISTTRTMQDLAQLPLPAYLSHDYSTVPPKSPWHPPAATILAVAEKSKAFRRRHAKETAVVRGVQPFHEFP